MSSSSECYSPSIHFKVFFFIMTECTPGLPELIIFQAKSRKINIVREISTNWRYIGIALLNDTSGATVSSLHKICHYNEDHTCLEILTRWVQGSGIDDRSWQGLLGVLDVYCETLAAEIRDALCKVS